MVIFNDTLRNENPAIAGLVFNFKEVSLHSHPAPIGNRHSEIGGPIRIPAQFLRPGMPIGVIKRIARDFFIIAEQRIIPSILRTTKLLISIISISGFFP